MAIVRNNKRELILKDARYVRSWALKNYAPTNLRGWCGVCSRKIFQRLIDKGFHPTFCKVKSKGRWHCYVSCFGYIVDVTASQFGDQFKKIIVMKERDELNEWFWNKDRAEEVDTIEEVEQSLNGWPTVEMLKEG